MDITKFAEGLKQVVVIGISFVEAFSGDKAGEGKKAEVVKIVKGALDKIVDVPDNFDFIEDYIIGVLIDIVVKYLNEKGIFQHKEKAE